MLDKVIAMLQGEGLYALGYVLWLLTGIVNAIVNTKVWSWEKTKIDVLKFLILSVVLVGLVVLADGLEWWAGALGFDLSEVMNGVSTGVLFAGVAGGVAFYYGRAVKNTMNLLRLSTNGVVQTKAELDYSAAAAPVREIAAKIFDSFSQPAESVETQIEFEQEGGRGAVFSLPIDSYQSFRAAVIGKGFDIDGSWGSQCWDGCALLWQQLGKSLLTGNGCASGCWELKRDVNAGTDFDLIMNPANIRPGDVLVFWAGEFGHIGFADEAYTGDGRNGSIKLLGQNQGGAPYPGGGSNFNVVNMSMATFLGAFRYKGWAEKSTQPSPTVAEKPKTKPVEKTFDRGDRVKVTKLIDVNGTRLLNLQNNYLVSQVSKATRTAVLKTEDGDIYARMSFDNLEKA